MEIALDGIVVETQTLTIVGVVPHVEMTVMTEVTGDGVKHVTTPNTKQELAEVLVDLEVPVEPVVTAVKDKEIIGQQNLVVAVQPVPDELTDLVGQVDLVDLEVEVEEITVTTLDKVVLEEPEETVVHSETLVHLETQELQETKELQVTQEQTETMVMEVGEVLVLEDLVVLEDLAEEQQDITYITAVT